ncbi:hypothetical protein ABZ135_11580 [Streptomyces sp. NPDC006339]|uniref:LppU/SCO3897 family protein n=1 Tax=Streptomyces sp. NPDC006339 TaxID=3156755 RepID=UPI0033AB0A25
MTTPQPSDPFAAPVPGTLEQAPAPEKKKGGVLKKICGLVVLVIVAVAVKLGLPHLTGDAPVHAKVGECVTVTGPDDAPNVDTQDCSSGKAALFKVAQVHEGTFDLEKCDRNKYSALAQQLGSDKFVFCLEEVAAK